MNQLLTNQNIYEALLVAYFSETKAKFLNSSIIHSLDLFMEFCKSEDELNGTNNAELIQKVYANSKLESRQELLKRLCISETSLFRFRTKVIERLEKYILSTMNKDIVSK